jgi:hypothetical protein
LFTIRTLVPHPILNIITTPLLLWLLCFRTTISRIDFSTMGSKLPEKTTVNADFERLDMISEYDHCLNCNHDKIVEAGTYGELIEPKGVLYELVNRSRE